LVTIIQQTESVLTNQLASTFAHLADLTSNANRAVVTATPLLSNLAVLSEHLRDPQGALGRWVIPPDLYAQVLTAATNANLLLTDTGTALTNTSAVLTHAGTVLTAAQTNLGQLVAALQPPLDQLTVIVSNLNTQVTANTNFVTTLHTLLVDLDDLIQGFKRHWLLRGAFKTPAPSRPPSTNPPPRRLTSPRGAELFR
jgi:ABC-type transporter Mla subunit MlaD